MNRIPLYILLILLLTMCKDNPRDIYNDEYVGIVYQSHPTDKDISFVPSDNTIRNFEQTIKSDLLKVINNSSDTILKKNSAKIISDIRLYKRRYFGVITTESFKMLIVDFIHPNSFSIKDEWTNPLWTTTTKDNLNFSIHFYPDDKTLFNIQLRPNYRP